MARNALIEHYQSKRADALQQIEVLTTIAMGREDHALTDQDREVINGLNAEIDGYNRDLEAVARETDLSQQAQNALARVTSRQVNPNHRYRSEGQAIWDVLHRHSDDAAAARLQQLQPFDEQVRAFHEAGGFLARAAQHMGTTAAATTPTAGGFDGLIVNPILGPVVTTYPTDTPFWTLLGPRNVPSGKFLRPRLVDPDLLTAAGPHAGGLQKGEIPSKKWDYDSDLVAKQTIGNYINLSYEAIEWVPSAIQQVIDHLRLRTSLGLESRAVAEADKTGNVIDLPADADAAAVQAAVWAAMAAVFKATGQPATWMAGGPDGLAMLGSKTDLAGRPLFPFVGPANALGTASGTNIIQPFGLTFATTFAITDTTLYVGNSVGLEAYVTWFPTLQADEPSVVGRQIGVAAAVGFFSPVTLESPDGGTTPAERNAVVKLEAA